ncbi:uncharacterized protein L199_004823 [Kwoniella botswanensis]|uniref:uncharacterized protein n=1 Tax=Kwoniella botswanensis TaxID=1268659 RepID=UPI00315D8804
MAATTLTEIPNDSSKELAAYDVAVQAVEVQDPHHGTKRGLKPRHVQMMAISGAIGTGLFLGTGTTLAKSGPLSLFLGYVVYAGLFLVTYNAMGEMVCYMPIDGSFIRFANKFVDESFSFAFGWLYIYNASVVVAAELVAIPGLINYWNTSINNAVWCAIGLASYIGLNVCGVHIFGEGEFFLSSFKVFLIIGLIFFAFITMCGGNPTHDAFGFRYWVNPGAMNQYLVEGSTGRFLGFWSVFTNAAYAFGGPDYIALAAGEVKSPRRVLPSVFSRVHYRVTLFYVLGVLAVGVLNPYDDPALTSAAAGGGSSPFVIAAHRMGIPILPDIINAIIMTSAWSCGLEITFAASRSIYAQALAGQGPKFFARTYNGVPTAAVLVVCAVGALCFMATSNDASVVFTWITSLVGSCTFIVMGFFNLTYLRFHYAMRAQGKNRSDLPFTRPFQVYLSWGAMFFFAILLLTNGFAVFIDGHWSIRDFIFAYLSIPAFVVPWICHKLYTRQSWKLAPLADIDLTTGIAEIEALAENEAPLSNTRLARFERWLWG